MSFLVCACSSEACRVLGCAKERAIRRNAYDVKPAAPELHGWYCPGCGSYHAPHLPTCPAPKPRTAVALRAVEVCA